MTFSRYSEQCINCANYIDNADPEAKTLMDEACIECSLECNMFEEHLCEFFVEATD